jgi:DNA-directed RNA polymerase subunit RPC12/RpoP
METLVKCKCQHCNQSIEFDSDGAGQKIACPNCGMETLLFIPAKPIAPPTAPHATPPQPKGDSAILLSVLNAILCVVSFGLIAIGCAGELSENGPNSSAIRQTVYAVQYGSGFILLGLCFVVSGLIRLIRK